MASQAGYGLGLLFFLPLGDILERSRLVLTQPARGLQPADAARAIAVLMRPLDGGASC